MTSTSHYFKERKGQFSPPSQPVIEDGKQTYNIYFIRHSISCANIIKLKGRAGPINAIKNLITRNELSDDRAIFAPDSGLTYSGLLLALMARRWLSTSSSETKELPEFTEDAENALFDHFREFLGDNLNENPTEKVINLIAKSPAKFFTRIYSSHLRRAIQTAVTLFASSKDTLNFVFNLPTQSTSNVDSDDLPTDMKINIVPYINETRSPLALGNDKDNEWLGQNSLTQAFYSVKNSIDYSKINPSDTRLNESGDIHTWIQKILIPDIKTHNIPPGSNIAVVCHSHLIKNLYNSLCRKTMYKLREIPNTGIIHFQLEINPDAQLYNWIRTCQPRLIYSPPRKLLTNPDFLHNVGDFCGPKFASLDKKDTLEEDNYNNMTILTSLYKIPSFICRNMNENSGFGLLQAVKNIGKTRFINNRITMQGIIYALQLRAKLYGNRNIDNMSPQSPKINYDGITRDQNNTITHINFPERDKLVAESSSPHSFLTVEEKKWLTMTKANKFIYMFLRQLVLGKYVKKSKHVNDFPLPDVVIVNSLNLSAFEYALLLFGSREIITEYFDLPRLRRPTAEEMRADPELLCVIEYFEGQLPGMSKIESGRIYVTDFYRHKTSNIIFPVYKTSDVEGSEKITDFVISQLLEEEDTKKGEESANLYNPRFMQINPKAEEQSVLQSGDIGKWLAEKQRKILIKLFGPVQYVITGAGGKSPLSWNLIDIYRAILYNMGNIDENGMEIMSAGIIDNDPDIMTKLQLFCGRQDFPKTYTGDTFTNSSTIQFNPTNSEDILIQYGDVVKSDCMLPDKALVIDIIREVSPIVRTFEETPGNMILRSRCNNPNISDKNAQFLGGKKTKTQRRKQRKSRKQSHPITRKKKS